MRKKEKYTKDVINARRGLLKTFFLGEHDQREPTRHKAQIYTDAQVHTSNRFFVSLIVAGAGEGGVVGS